MYLQIIGQDRCVLKPSVVDAKVLIICSIEELDYPASRRLG